MVLAYVRVSSAAQSCSGQEYEITVWSGKSGISVDRWVRETVSGTVEPSKRKLGPAIRRMKKGDLLVCTELSRLGRNMLMIMSILNECASRGVRIHTIKDRFDLDNNINSKIIAFAFALAAEIERNLISQRTREALADRKAAGVRLGRPPGSYKRKNDVLKDIKRIGNLMDKGVSLENIARLYGIHRNTLVKYLKSEKKE